MDADGIGLAPRCGPNSRESVLRGEILRHSPRPAEIVRNKRRPLGPTVDPREAGLPESVREVVGARCAGSAREAITGGGCGGGRRPRVRRDLGRGCVDLDDDAVFDILVPAMTAGLVAEFADAPIGSRLRTPARAAHPLRRSPGASAGRLAPHRRRDHRSPRRRHDPPGRGARDPLVCRDATGRAGKAIGYAVEPETRPLTSYAPSDASRLVPPGLRRDHRPALAARLRGDGATR